MISLLELCFQCELQRNENGRNFSVDIDGIVMCMGRKDCLVFHKIAIHIDALSDYAEAEKADFDLIHGLDG